MEHEQSQSANIRAGESSGAGCGIGEEMRLSQPQKAKAETFFPPFKKKNKYILSQFA